MSSSSNNLLETIDDLEDKTPVEIVVELEGGSEIKDTAIYRDYTQKLGLIWPSRRQADHRLDTKWPHKRGGTTFSIIIEESDDELRGLCEANEFLGHPHGEWFTLKNIRPLTDKEIQDEQS